MVCGYSLLLLLYYSVLCSIIILFGWLLLILLSSIILYNNTYILQEESTSLRRAPDRPRCISPVSSDPGIQNDITLQRTIFSRDNNRIVKSWEEFLVLQLAQLLRRRLWPVVLGQWFAKRSLLSVNVQVQHQQPRGAVNFQKSYTSLSCFSAACLHW